jgi:hypothetical protein
MAVDNEGHTTADLLVNQRFADSSNYVAFVLSTLLGGNLDKLVQQRATHVITTKTRQANNAGRGIQIGSESPNTISTQGNNKTIITPVK